MNGRKKISSWWFLFVILDFTYKNNKNLYLYKNGAWSIGKPIRVSKKYADKYQDYVVISVNNEETPYLEYIRSVLLDGYFYFDFTKEDLVVIDLMIYFIEKLYNDSSVINRCFLFDSGRIVHYSNFTRTESFPIHIILVNVYESVTILGFFLEWYCDKKRFVFKPVIC